MLLNLRQNADGSVMGFAQGKDGRFIGQARWVKSSAVGARIAASAVALVGHAMLVEISHKLDRVEAKLNLVVQALADDRRADLRGCIKQVEDALRLRSVKNRDGLLYATAPRLRAAVEKEIQALERAVEQLPTPPKKFINGFFWDTTSETLKALKECEASVLAIMEGIRAIGRLYTALDSAEGDVAWSVTAELLNDLKMLDLRKVYFKARMVRPSERHPWPELFWSQTIEAVSQGHERALSFASAMADNAMPPALVLEFSSEEVTAIIDARTADKVTTTGGRVA